MPRRGVALVQPLPPGLGTPAVPAPRSACSDFALTLSQLPQEQDQKQGGGDRQTLLALLCHSRAKEEP